MEYLKVKNSLLSLFRRGVWKNYDVGGNSIKGLSKFLGREKFQRFWAIGHHFHTISWRIVLNSGAISRQNLGISQQFRDKMFWISQLFRGKYSRSLSNVKDFRGRFSLFSCFLYNMEMVTSDNYFQYEKKILFPAKVIKF